MNLTLRPRNRGGLYPQRQSHNRFRFFQKIIQSHRPRNRGVCHSKVPTTSSQCLFQILQKSYSECQLNFTGLKTVAGFCTYNTNPMIPESQFQMLLQFSRSRLVPKPLKNVFGNVKHPKIPALFDERSKQVPGPTWNIQASGAELIYLNYTLN